MKFQPLEKNILEIQAALENRQITSKELTEYYLKRVEAYDKQGPKLNSIVTISKNALKEAEILDAERSVKGKRGDLHGIPIVIKDNIDTFDMPTSASSVLMADNHPSRDAFIVKKLRDAGAIILAKTNLSEFACHGFTAGTLIGQTLNPYDLSRTPGGSSGGSGVSVAANFAACGLGTDTVNSVRSPASATNLVGFRPSTGLLSRGGIIPVSETQDTAGTLTRCVSDAAILMDVCIGFDPEDKITAEQVGHVPKSYKAYLKKDGLKDKRFGLITNLIGNDPDVSKVMEHSIELMRSEGAEVIPLEIPEFNIDRLSECCDVQLYEFKRQMDCYLKKATSCPVPNFEYIADSDMLHPAVSGFVKKCAKVDNIESCNSYELKLLNNHRNRTFAYYLMAKHKLDAFVYPHQTVLVQHIALQSQPGRNGLIASTLGFPAVTVPAGFSRRTEDALLGVPIGIEFMARRWNEPLLFEVAFGFEYASQHRRLPLTTPDIGW